MFKRIRKRDGSLRKFDSEKIAVAIGKAGEVTGEFSEKTAQRLALKVLNITEGTIKQSVPTVEQIQDIVESVLLDSTFKDTAKAYILYRDQRRQVRELTSRANIELIESYLEKLDWKVKENSNMTYSLQGLNNHIASEMSKVYWLNKVYPAEIREAHGGGDLHIHDLSLLSVYCVGWDLMDLLQQGFKGVSGKIESNPPKHLRTALGQVINFFYTLQGEAAGAQALSSFDTLLAPFIRYDKLTHKEVEQCLQEFLFNVNVPTRVGFQTPFTNITLDLKVPKIYAKQHVIIGGVPQKEKYGEFQKEMDLLNRTLLELMAKGDAKGRVFTFPIPTYNITKDFDWDNKNHDALWEVTAKYGIPYFSNYVNSDLKPEDARSMCCRLRIDNTKLTKRGGGLFGANPLTGSVGVVTINMPRLGYLAASKEDFLERLGKLMEISKDSLEIKREVLETFTEKDLYPYTKFYLRLIKEKTGAYWTNHFSTIGLVGMNEACMNFIGKGISTAHGKDFALEVMDFMRAKLDEFQEETGHHYNLEATPAEGTSFRLAKIDKGKYPDIIVANEEFVQEGAHPFYTNSTQLPVYHTDDIFEYLDNQNELQTKYTGGTVVHLFAGEKIDNANTVKSLVRTICDMYELPYFSITPTFSVCPTHGYVAGEHVECPTCKSACEVYSRIVGYLRPVKQWNDGKKAEYDVRKTFKMETCAPGKKTAAVRSTKEKAA
jgi:ribonucleoside-triphosphate reductase (formate)